MPDRKMIYGSWSNSNLGENAAVESGYEDQLSEMKRSIGNGDLTKSEDLTYRLTQKEIDDAKKGRPSAHYLQVMALKQQRDMDIRKLEKAVGMNSGVTAEVKGFGTLTGGFNTGTNSDLANDIAVRVAPIIMDAMNSQSERPINVNATLYTENNEVLAKAVNRGNRSLDKRYHPLAQYSY